MVDGIFPLGNKLSFLLALSPQNLSKEKPFTDIRVVRIVCGVVSAASDEEVSGRQRDVGRHRVEGLRPLRVSSRELDHLVRPGVVLVSRDNRAPLLKHI